MRVALVETPKNFQTYDQILSGEVYCIRNIDRTGWIPVMKMNDGNVFSLVSGAKIKNHLERDYYPTSSEIKVTVL